ncbi:LuxR family transcriptional regulator [Cognatishimia sp. SS12]|uniref:helix-turn-helix transcriptional regulator n=1 Tax=Cognatishimia sp. SS12 TaxID=2979465 RepID=UPI00232AA7DE|nr:LuxR family transcriptional regulator [Cognatishimia sp. SS12]MDC0737195.1 LuxR family transcriptional regulator [Cognatishimia sp. SS12]
MPDRSLRYLAELTSATSLEALWAMHVAKMADYGFDRLIYGFTNFRVNRKLGDPEDFIVLSNHCPDYLERFFGERMFLHGPMIHWALENDGACSWGHIAEKLQKKTLTDQELAVLEFNQSFGVTAGYTISFKSVSQRAKGAIGLTGPAGTSQAALDAIWAEHGAALQLMNNVLHLKILTLPYENPKRALTRRQREVLEWVSDGKTVQDIATLIGRTPATVEKHLRLAREALAVETTAQAVLKASLQRQMFIVENS